MKNKIIEKNKKNKMSLETMLFYGIVLMLVSTSAFCANPFDGALTKVTDFLTGTTGRALAVIAVSIAAIGMMFGRIQLDRFFYIIGGIAILFGAPAFVDLFK